MSLSPAQMRFIAETGLFDDVIRRAVTLVQELAPLLWHLSLARQRARSRLVTRRKQRRQW